MTRKQIDTVNQAANAPGRKVKFTVFRNKRGLMAKRLSLAADGSLVKKAAATMYEGSAETVTNTLAGLADLLPALDQHEALGLGICDRAPVDIVKADALAQHPDAVARTTDYFHFPSGPALIYFDGDTGASMDALHAAITAACPQFAGAEKLAVYSTSAGVYRIGEAEPVALSKGLHLYTTVVDGQDIPRFGKVLCQRLWLTGHGHIEVGAAGQFLVRQIIDGLVFAPERIVFEGAPVLGAGLERRPPAPVYIPGESLDTASCADLSPEEEQQYQRMIAAAKAAKESEAADIHAAWLHGRGLDISKARKIPYAEAVAVAEKAAAGMDLAGDFILHFQKFGRVAVADIVKGADTLAKYDGHTLHDPLEPDYKSPFCAIFYANKGEPPVVYSQAHGGQTFKLPALLASTRKAAAGEVDGEVEIFDKEPPPAPKPWEGITDAQVAAAIEGTLLEAMVRTLAAVTVPPLPIQLTLPKGIGLAACALSQPVEYDHKTESRRGLDLARNVIETAGGQLCNAMVCIVAPTGCGKDISNMVTYVAQEHGVHIGHAGSAEGLADAYVTNGAGLTVISELQPYLNPRHWQYAATGFFTAGFNQHSVKVRLSTRNGEPRDCRYCAPNVIANIQPAVFAEIGDTLLLDNGFLNRFLFSYLPEIRSWRPNTQPVSRAPLSAAFQAYKRIQARVTVPANYLQEVLDEFFAHDAPLPGHFNRLVNEYGPRLAVMLAANPNRPSAVEITPDHWARAGVLLRWFYAAAAQVLSSIGEDRYVKKMEGRLDRMISWIRKHPNGVSKKIFSQAFHRGTTAEDRDRDLRELQERGRIHIHTTGGKTTIRPAMEGAR